VWTREWCARECEEGEKGDRIGAAAAADLTGGNPSTLEIRLKCIHCLIHKRDVCANSLKTVF
jgi:hypothetical protein